MKTLASLLERFKKSIGQDTFNKETIISVIEECSGIRLLPEDVSIKSFTLEIVSSPAKKNEIRLKEELILSSIREQTKQNVSRILYK